MIQAQLFIVHDAALPHPTLPTEDMFRKTKVLNNGATCLLVPNEHVEEQGLESRPTLLTASPVAFPCRIIHCLSETLSGRKRTRRETGTRKWRETERKTIKSDSHKLRAFLNLSTFFQEVLKNDEKLIIFKKRVQMSTVLGRV